MAAAIPEAQRRELRGSLRQSQRMRALCKIVVDGVDVTRGFDPHLISLHTVARLGSAEADTTDIELDDRDGRLAIPPPRAELEISLGWMNESLGVVWTGEIQQVESGFSRRGGARRLWLQAISYGWYTLKKTHFRQAWGDGEGKEVTLEEVLQEAGKNVGLEVRVSPSMRNITRQYWSMNESFLNFGYRLAKELGGDFKVTGKIATMTNQTDGMNVAGEKLLTIDANWGENLIQWRIMPFSAAPQGGTASNVVYNRLYGRWEQFDKPIEGDLPFGLTESILSLPAPAANRVTAQQWNIGLDQGARGLRGIGSVTINGEPAAQVGCRVSIKGARAGVDGTYATDVVEHSYSRTGGFVTTLSLKQPEFIEGFAYGKEWGWVKPEVRSNMPTPIPAVPEETKK